MRIKVRYQDLNNLNNELKKELEDLNANINSLKDTILSNVGNSWTGVPATAFKDSILDDFLPYLKNIHKNLDYYRAYMIKTVSKYDRLDNF